MSELKNYLDGALKEHLGYSEIYKVYELTDDIIALIPDKTTINSLNSQLRNSSELLDEFKEKISVLYKGLGVSVRLNADGSIVIHFKVGPIVRDVKKRKPTKKAERIGPKRPQSAYFLWLNFNRESIKKSNPGASVTDVAKIAGAQWRNVTASEKKQFEDLSTKDKERYQTEMAAYKKA